ncbi:dihydropteroate synthase [Henriciella sp.]|uniref:dihydropteroate synthase n=1 Tax=Henriciella sp. TaxID=1968823 RepID=UPI0017E5EF7B|nr:dihydropteroate synthase [Henriciella sp.]HIG21388.1 dihydropteroate synthase [Henriciella sp.]
MRLSREEKARLRDALLSEARKRTLIMGILNVTPDSFSDGGKFDEAGAALAHAEAMVAAGADILDVGGESTRPGAARVSEADELARTVSVVEALAGPGRVPVSIDTYKAGVAKAACEAGAVIVNDVSAMSDPAIVGVAAEAGAAYVLTYNRGEKDEALDAGADMLAFFERAVAASEAEGLPRAHVILDPGVGFAKTFEQNFQVLARVGDLVGLGLPVLIGVSRKSFIGKRLGIEAAADRDAASVAVGLDSLRRGAHMLRVHDVAAHRQAIELWETIENAAH